MVTRALNGFAAGSVMAVGAAAICDMYFMHQRGVYMGIYTLCLTNGSNIVPIVGGFAAELLEWRACFYIPGYLQLGTFLITLFCLPQTLFVQKPATGYYQEQSYVQNLLFRHSNVPARRPHVRDFIRPFQMLKFMAIIFPTALYMASFGYGSVLFALTGAEFFTRLYGFTTPQTGLMLSVPLLIGGVLGEFGAGWMTGWLSNRYAKKNNGERLPEARLTAIWGAMLVPIGIIVEGACLTYYETASWVGSAFGMGQSNMGLQIATAIYAYTTDCFKVQSAEVSTILNLFRQVFSCLVSFYALPLTDKIGIQSTWVFHCAGINWLYSPACTEMERIVMDWVAKALGLPDVFWSSSLGGGVIQNSASDAIATTIKAARERSLQELTLAEGLKEGMKEYEDRKMELQSRLVAIVSDQTHSSGATGALIAGIRSRSVKTHLRDNMEMTGQGLQEVLEKCEKDGLIPFHLIMTFGTTNTCSSDRFAEIQSVLQEKKAWQRIWVHVDGAYAGASLVADEWQYIPSDFVQGVDSFNMNTHKWLLVNFDASALYVRNRNHLTDAMDVTPAYLRNPYSDRGTVIDFRNWSFSLGRRFRALKIWFVLRNYGLKGLKAHIRKTINLGILFAELVRGRPDLFEIVTKPEFCVTVLRIKNPKRLTGDLAVCTPDRSSDTNQKCVRVDKLTWRNIHHFDHH